VVQTTLPVVAEQRVDVGDGVGLAVRTWDPPGRANAEALLLHGLASTSHIWDLVGPRLGRRGVRALAVDQRGHGRSSKPASGYGFERVCADAAAVIEATGLRRPVLVGHSWGANVALELAVRLPELVRSIVLVDGGFARLRDRFDWPQARRALAPPDLAGTPVSVFRSRMRSFLGETLEVTPEIEAAVLSVVHVDREGRIRARLSKANHLRILRALWEQDPIELLGRVRVPTLIVAARPPASSADPYHLDRRSAARAVRAIGGPVRFEWLAGIHDLPLQRPEALARRIVRTAGS
jgi:pimeloyl-ACP methyl ester carboxylesterase